MSMTKMTNICSSVCMISRNITMYIPKRSNPCKLTRQLNTSYQDDDPSTLHFSSLTLFFLGVFLFFMPLLLVNLLIGLAVGDIATVQRDAQQKKLATQVDFLVSAEEKLPCLSKNVVDDFKVYPNRSVSPTTFGEWYYRMAGLTFMALDKSPKIEETFLGKEMARQRTRLRDMFAIQEQNKVMLMKIMRKFDVEQEDELNDREENLSNKSSLEDLAATHAIGKKKSSIVVGVNRPSNVFGI